MTERNPGAEHEQARDLGRFSGLAGDSEFQGGTPEERRVTERLGRGDEEQLLALGGELFHPLAEARLDPARQR